MLGSGLLGGAAQRSAAILAAAPEVPDRSVAVASESFRRVHGGAPRMAIAASDLAMSVALAPGDVDTNLDGSTELAGSSGHAPTPFGPAMTWRVRGAGVCAVHDVALASPEP